MSFIKQLAKFGVDIGKTGLNVGKLSLGATATAAKFSIDHPYAALGIAGAGAYAILGDKSPYSSPSLDGVNMNVSSGSEMEAYSNLNTGVSPTGSLTPGISVRNQMMMDSTNGLTQALHRRRH